MIVSLDNSHGCRANSMRQRTADESTEQQITDAVSSITERRAVIEQAKGMLMVGYGIGPDAAFELLRNQSQRHNIKLRLLAEQVVEDLVALAASTQRDPRETVDTVFQTAHKRVAAGPAR